VPGASRGHRLWWATLAWLALIVLVVTVPIALLMVGGSPVAHLSLHRVGGDVLTRRDTDPRMVIHWVARGALILAWLCWAWLTVCVVVELTSRVTGRTTRTLPGSRTMQSMAACLVGTALTLSLVGRGMMAPAPAPAAASTTGPWRGPAPARTNGVHRVNGRHRSNGSRAPVATLAGLALIDDTDTGPLPWSEAGDGVDGADRAGGADGVAVDSAPPATAHPSVVTPGEPTARPASPARPPVDTTPPAGSGAGTHLVRTRETLWSIASAELGSSKRWKEIAALNYGVRQPDGGALTAEHWISPGWRLRMPRRTDVGADPVGEPAPARVAPAPLLLDDRLPSAMPDPVAVATTDPDVVTATGPDVARSSKDGVQPEPLPPLMPVGCGILGVGVVGILDRMRRVQQRHRATGEFIRLPDGRSSDIEQRLRLGDGADIVMAVDRALGLVADLPVGPAGTVLTVRGVKVRPDTVELVVPGIGALPFLPEVAGPPGAVAIGDDGNSLLIDRSMAAEVAGEVAAEVAARSASELGEHRAPSTARRSPAPLLVSVGRGDDELIMVNLESLGALAVAGDPAATDRVARALALELATSRWSGQFELLLAGFGAELERFDRVTAEAELPEALDRLTQRQVRVRMQLQTAGFRSCAEARRVEDSADWDPLVVIAGPTIDADGAHELLEAVGDPALGAAAVVATTGGAGGTLTLSAPSSLPGATPALDLLRAVVEPQGVDRDELDAITSLLDTAGSRESILSTAEPYVRLRLPEAQAVVTSGPDVAANGSTRRHVTQPPPGTGGQIEVMVLGPVEVRGAERAFTRSLAKDLVVYLAMHPNGAANEAWATALWPDRRMAPSSLHSTASVARRALGQSADGQDHLPRAHGRLQLAPSVTSDWDRFVALAEGDTSSWRMALELVRGRPFDGLRSTDWPILEGIAPAIEAAVVDLAGRLAGASLAAGDPRGAEWAARKGLVVSPYDERLYRMLMRAADLGGNPAGVEAAMAELVTLVAEDIEPLESVHPSTLALYRSLTRGRKHDPRVDPSGTR
jgi:DNA-binding SARP family transcriptional activator